MKKLKVSILSLLAMFVLSLVFPTEAKAYVLWGNFYPPTFQPQYFLDSSLSPYSSSTSAVTTWNYSGSPVTLKKVNQGSLAHIYMSFQNTSNGTYGITYQKSGGNSSIAFYNSFKNATLLQQREVVVHEVGHSLGLDHTQSSNNSISVMRAVGFNGKAYPLSDDKAGIKARFGLKSLSDNTTLEKKEDVIAAAKLPEVTDLNDLENKSSIIVKATKSKEHSPVVKKDSEGNIFLTYTMSDLKITQVYKNSKDNPISIDKNIEVYENEAYDSDENITYHVEGYQKMKQDEEYLLFLEETPEGYYVPVSVIYGKVSIANNEIETKFLDEEKNDVIKIQKEALLKYSAN